MGHLVRTAGHEPAPEGSLTPPSKRSPRRTGARLGWLATTVAASTVLGLARTLSPSPSGLGTHTQLGLPPCAFLSLSGVPCPTCGLTTSFTHLARGHFAAAFSAHPLGLVFFALCASVVPLATVLSLRGASLSDTLVRVLAVRLAIALAVLLLGHWLIRVAVLALGGA